MTTPQEGARLVAAERRKQRREEADLAEVITRCAKCNRTHQGTFVAGREWFRTHLCA